jgi:hypothetical protein
MADTETAIWQTIQRKKREHESMKVEMFEAMRREVIKKSVKNPYEPTQIAKMPSWLNGR